MKLGIDLGTACIKCAYVDDQGVACLVPDRHNPHDFLTPTQIHVGPDGSLIGRAVEDLLADQPQLDVGRFSIEALGSGDDVYADTLGNQWSAEAVGAVTLRKVVKDAETLRNTSVETAVLAVPTGASDRAKEGAREAALLAGIPRTLLVEEAVAVATYHRLRGAQTALVYNLGADAFEATVLHVAPDEFRVLATAALPGVGGDRFDEVILNAIAEGFQRRHRVDPRQDAATRVRLGQFARLFKRQLSSENDVRRPLLLFGRTYDALVTRRQFEDMIAPLVERTLETCTKCLMSVSLDWRKIDTLILVGGSTAVPLVRSRIVERSGLPPDRIQDQDAQAAVAFGAAQVAARLDPDDAERLAVEPITSFDLAMSVYDPSTRAVSRETLIPRNSQLPAEHNTTFYSVRSDQRRIVFELVQTQDSAVRVRLGRFSFGPIAAPRVNYPVEVSVTYDSDGVVYVKARDAETGQEMQRQVVSTAETDALRLARLHKRVMALRINE